MSTIAASRLPAWLAIAKVCTTHLLASAPPPPNDPAHQTEAGSATPVWCGA